MVAYVCLPLRPITEPLRRASSHLGSSLPATVSPPPVIQNLVWKIPSSPGESLPYLWTCSMSIPSGHSSRFYIIVNGSFSYYFINNLDFSPRCTKPSVLETLTEHHFSAIHWGYMLGGTWDEWRGRCGTKGSNWIESPYISGTVLGMSKAFLHLGLSVTLRSGYHYELYFTNVETEVQRGKMTRSKSLSSTMRRKNWYSRSVWLQSLLLHHYALLPA